MLKKFLHIGLMCLILTMVFAACSNNKTESVEKEITTQKGDNNEVKSQQIEVQDNILKTEKSNIEEMALSKSRLQKDDEIEQLEKVDTQEKAVINREIEKVACALIDHNVEAFSKIFYLDSLPFYDPESEDGSVLLGGIFPVKSDIYKTFSDLEKFVHSTYINEECNMLLYNLRNNGPLYLNQEGMIYVDSSKIGGVGYYKDWTNYKLDILNLTDNSADLKIYIKDQPPESEVKEIEINVKMIKEEDVWLLEKMVY